jgi:predicted ribosomally synthesized peptide with SipW-like signal peptide
MRNNRRKILLTLVVLGLTVTGIGLGTFAAFSATTDNTGNSITSGTVIINQHTGATTLYNLTNQKPGDSTSKCVRIAYTGSLAAAVKLYGSAGITNGSLFNLTVERGSGMTTLDNTMSCAGFTASSTAYSGQLGSFPSTYAAGADGKAAGAAWATNDAVDYRFTIVQNDDTTANAHITPTSSGSHTFTWEARNN